MGNTFNIGPWHVQPELNKLTLDSNEFVLEPLAMEVLIYFAKNPSKVISRDELIENIWNGRVVGDHAIYRIINQIRKTLNADSDHVYIKTIRKKGYQLDHPVEWHSSERSNNSFNAATVPPSSHGSLLQNTNKPGDKSSRHRYLMIATPLVVILMWFLWGFIDEHLSYKSITKFNKSAPISFLVGQEKDASFSKDGLYVSYSHRSKPSENFKIYVQPMDGASPQKLTYGSGDDFSPTWSPDGKSIAFIRHNDGQCQIMKLNVSDEAPTPEFILGCESTDFHNVLIWSDDNHLFFNAATTSIEPYKIYRYSLNTSKKEQLTNPSSGKGKGDIYLSLSNDGANLAFLRDINWSKTQVMLLDLSKGNVSELFELNGWKRALTWSLDGRALFYIKNNENINAYSLKHGFHKTVYENSNAMRSLSGTNIKNSITVTTGKTGIDIWQQSLSNLEETAAVIESSEVELFPEFANQSNNISFVSHRTGKPQIWIKNHEGTEYQLSNFEDFRIIEHLSWSPDDEKILSSSANELFTLDFNSKQVDVLWRVEHPFRIEAASWAHDGNSVYFSSDIDGDWQIYELNIQEKSKPSLVTNKGGYKALELEDGDLVYFKYHKDGIWKLDTESGEEVMIIDDTNVFSYNGLYPAGNGIYYISISEKGNLLTFYDFPSKQTTAIVEIKNPIFDYSISKDRERILFPKLTNDETQIIYLKAEP